MEGQFCEHPATVSAPANQRGFGDCRSLSCCSFDSSPKCHLYRHLCQKRGQESYKMSASRHGRGMGKPSPCWCPTANPVGPTCPPRVLVTSPVPMTGSGSQGAHPAMDQLLKYGSSQAEFSRKQQKEEKQGTSWIRLS